MRPRPRHLPLAIAAIAAAFGLALARPAPAAADAGRDEARQILVMLRAAPSHYRPNSDYGGGYGDGAGRGARLRVAEQLARAHGVSLASEWPMPMLGVDCFIMVVPPDRSPDDVAAQLSREPGVSWSEPMHLYHAQAGPRGETAAAARPARTPSAAPVAPVAHNDPLYRAQPAAVEWRLAELHQLATGRKVRVAVVDSAIQRNHPDLAGQVELSQNFVAGRPDTAELHGTGVAGIIAARADNGLGIAGVAPGARLMALRACWQETGATDPGAPTTCDSLSLARAIIYAIDHGAQIINLSLSGPPDQLLSRLIDEAIARGAVVVAAYDRGARSGGFPASHSGVVAVVDEPVGSAAAPGVFAAPGRDVPTTQPGGRWFLVNGSSFAAAHVTGLFALLRERGPVVHSSAALVVAQPGETIDACATLLRTSGPCNCSCSTPREFLASASK